MTNQNGDVLTSEFRRRFSKATPPAEEKATAVMP